MNIRRILLGGVMAGFGTGLKTAAYAALVVWLCDLMFHIDWLLVGMMSAGTYGLASGLALLQVLISSSIGSRLYSETSRQG